MSRSIAILGLCLVGGVNGCCTHPLTCPAANRAWPRSAAPPLAIHSDRPLAVIGDIQDTLIWERLFLFRESNHRETGELVCQLGRERPAATVLLGDLVSWGASESSWKRFDELASRMSGLLLPIRGNHEYFGDREDAREAWLQRFPWFDQTLFYSLIWNRIGLVFLDSNLEQLELGAQVAQRLWYERTLVALERAAEVDGTLVFLHHPPYTNNPNAQGDLDSLRTAFVSPFCRHAKALGMIAGHAHGYERYGKLCGKRVVQFIVSGGGGGPRPNTPPCFNDECLASGCCDPTRRPLHYLLLKHTPTELEISVQTQRLNGADGLLEVVHIPFGERGESVTASSRCGRQSMASQVKPRRTCDEGSE